MEDKKHPLLKILLLDVSEFAGGALVVFTISAVILGVLNYFNVVSLSSIYKPLSILPRQTNLALQGETLEPQTASKPSNSALQNHSALQNPSSTPTQQIFTQKDAEQVFSAFVSQNLIPSSSPQLSKITFTQDKIMKNTFQSVWQTEAGTASATFALSTKNPKTFSYLYLAIPVLTDVSASPSVQFAQKITPSYFSTKPKSTWKCSTPQNNIVYCENFWEENDAIKRGIGLSGAITNSNQKKIMAVSFCEFRDENKRLAASKSCRAEFAAIGIW